MNNQRAYTVLNIKSMDDEERVIEGIATTPTPDRMNDVVDSKGAKFKLPMPLLWQHDHSKPVGFVEFAEPTDKGIPFRARISKVDEPGTLRDRVEEAWQSVKYGLVRAVSIGFRALEYNYMDDSDGIHFKEWEWMELSLVTIPANAEATIMAVKKYDAAHRPASGQKEEKRQNQSHIVRLNDRDKSQPFVIQKIKR